ncbi:E3 ubiquitin-protein ligase BRE1-like 2 isoform X1 [Chenopodium quinoa]|uniref:E3 ubiquitin-protein ligase BRE1-like 2 isoform X1 n=1 Tax=Chenopodium quinoa TaxID=63459 RepID=UPI000B778E50|nr:E3 ubiquitin-protein ligase BRE1-like 2 isoform X1 [Chenopodium quinoa]
MENAELEEPEKKRPHLSSDSSPMARNSNLSPDNKSVDAAVLQYQNQKLVQQLDAQKHELHDLEVKIQELKERQSSYDDMLTTIKQLWNQLIDDVVFIGVRAGGSLNVLQTLDSEDYAQGSNSSCPAEHVLLCRLLNVDSVKGNGGEDHVKSVEEIFSQHYSSILDLLRFFENFVEDQKKKTFSIAQEMHENLSTEGPGDAITKLNKIEDLMTEEASSLRVVIDDLHLKHSQYADRIQSYIQNKSVDETEIKHIAGELEESMAELEESRRKLVNLRMQKNLASGTYSPVTGVMNGNLSSLKLPDKSMGLRELKHSIEEAEVLAADRLAELEDAREDNSILSKQLEEIEKEMKDDKYVCSSRLYTLVNDQLHHWKAEVARYKTLTDSLQSDRSYLIRREKELELKKESADSAKASIDKAETRVEELELKFQNSIIEKNELEAKMEEAVQDSGRTDIKSEFNVMASALSKEMGMVEAQLNRWKDISQEALSLRGEAETQKALLNRKTSEVKALGDKCGQQMAEIKSLKELIEKLQKEKLELQIFVDMLGQGIYDNRDLMEIQESERRACAQAEVLKHALDEHNLELRIKAANEAEAACQLRLSVAEAEIADLRAKLDTTEREVCELTEAIKIKDAEAEAYISEIETIGQAYEDMQTQNQHLLLQMTERDDYNIKLVSESVKTKQAVNTLLTEKQALAKQFQSVNASLESLRARISRSEEQMKAIMSEALNHCQEDRHLIVSLERAKWELSDVEKELKWVKSAIASSEKEYEQVQRKTADIQKELGSERNDKKKLEEELRQWKDRVVEMTAETGEAAIQRLQEEIKDCKSILKCSVCFDRPKEVVIVKCYHLFCNQCIQRNLEIRHRKCPGCGTAFGQNDVRFVKI